ncbi:MAG: glycosyltransferase [Bacteroidetes bacterium]|nr:glycosyltransferase [Bacteroidota bacterium]
MHWVFWTSLALIVYTYLGYGPVVWALSRLRQWLRPRPSQPPLDDDALPAVTLVIAAYNEAAVIDEKLANVRALDYPADKLDVVFVTDGSTDGTPDRLRRAADIRLLHQTKRAGKTAALNRAMQHVTTPLVVFSDANAMLNPGALRHLVRPYQNPSVGAVAGEKRVRADDGAVAGAGEGLYWRYESTLRRWDARLHSVMGGAGELFSVRTALFRPLPPDTLLDDFVMTLRIAGQGYRIAYVPEAYATEGPSASLTDEMARKVRIAAGGLQATVRLRTLLNPFRHGLLSFQLLSHRVLRWTLAPAALPVCLGANLALALSHGDLYTALLAGQLVLYGLAGGYGLYLLRPSTRPTKPGGPLPAPAVLYAPFYFALMNAAVYLGMIRYLRGRQAVTWQRAQRAPRPAANRTPPQE